jgi:hypothetical protein
VGGWRLATVATLASEVEDRPQLPAGREERFAGYGIMGLPFASGHVLAMAMRRFPASSIGPAYTSIWHCDPAGKWVFWQNQSAQLGCPRYFSAAIAETHLVDIDLEWIEPDTLRVAVPEFDFEWRSTLRGSAVTTCLNAVGSVIPDRLWKAKPLLSAMGPIAGVTLRAGRVALAGVAPNGQRFVANPLRVWVVADARASLGGVDFGPIGRLDRQATLGEFRIPQRGIFAIGRAYFTDE